MHPDSRAFFFLTAARIQRHSSPAMRNWRARSNTR